MLFTLKKVTAWGMLLFLHHTASAETYKSLNADMQALKAEVLELNRELKQLEEQLLTPATSSYTVFFAVDPELRASVQSVSIDLDGKRVAQHVYGNAEVSALLDGGVHKLLMANTSPGEHQLKVVVSGTTLRNDSYKQAVQVKFKKNARAKYIELRVTDKGRSGAPTIVAKDW